MEYRSKTYRFGNGYSTAKVGFYDGYNMNYYWAIFSPNGEVYMKCGSYEEARDIIKTLKDTRGYAYGEI